MSLIFAEGANSPSFCLPSAGYIRKRHGIRRILRFGRIKNDQWRGEPAAPALPDRERRELLLSPRPPHCVALELIVATIIIIGVLMVGAGWTFPSWLRW